MKVLFLRPPPELEEMAVAAVKKFNAICNTDAGFIAGANTNAIAPMVEAGQVDVIFISKVMEGSDVNSFFGMFSRCKKKPFIICCTDVFEQLAKEISQKKMLRCAKDFTEHFIFSCIRSLLTPPNQKLDIRYIKSIITSVISVVLENTQVVLTPGGIAEQKAAEKPEQVTVVLGFYGDGFLGSLTIGVGMDLLKHFTKKMLFCEDDDLNDDLMMDVFNEISNQTLGVIRTELAEFGYRLTTSLQSVTMSEGSFLHGSSSNGQYYSVPFSAADGLGKFDIMLCYNTYQTPLAEIATLEEGGGNKKDSVLDVRLVNKAIDSVKEVVKGNLSMEVTTGGICQHLAEVYRGDSLHVFHIGGFQGSMVMGLEIPNETSYMFFRTMMGMGKDDVDSEGINDLFGEMINQIGGEFIKKVKDFGYAFQRIFHGTYSSKGGFSYLLKNPGLYMRIEFMIGDYPFFLLFGMNSQFASHFFNLWPYYKQQKTFANQIKLVLPDPYEEPSEDDAAAADAPAASTGDVEGGGPGLFGDDDDEGGPGLFDEGDAAPAAEAKPAKATPEPAAEPAAEAKPEEPAPEKKDEASDDDGGDDGGGAADDDFFVA